MPGFPSLSSIPPFRWLAFWRDREARTELWQARRGEILILVLILVVGAALRLYGLNWDGGHWLHPDERKIYFVVMGLDWPDSLAEALGPDSPLNPRFFAYGSLPIYLLKLVTALLKPFWPALRSFGNLHLAGRPLAVLFDLGTVYLTYRLGSVLWPSFGKRNLSRAKLRGGLRTGALVAAAFVSLAVLHVQGAHFYTVDSLLTFTVLLTLYLAAGVAQGGPRRSQIALGVALGLALATKVTAAPLLLVVWAAYSVRIGDHKSRLAGFFAVAWSTILTVVLAGAVFFLTQPYALIDWPTFLDDAIQEAQIARGTLDAPYTLQYVGTWPFLYSMWQTAVWGLGPPLGLVAWAGLAASLIRWLRQGTWADLLLLAWAGPYFVTVGLLHTRYLRYMLPLVPVLCIMAVRLLADLGWGWDPEARDSGGEIRPRPLYLVYGALCILSLIYALLFAQIYAGPHSWIAASEWIFREVPAGSTMAMEYWDTPLPLPVELDGVPRDASQYAFRTLTLYDEPDDAVKWGGVSTDGSAGLSRELANSDYLILASRRLYGSILRASDRYPVATRYYEQLFAGNLGFEQVAEFTRGPGWLNPRLPPLPDAAPTLLHPDESFVVYDHPRALIFRNVDRLPAGELLRRLELVP